MKFLLHLHFYQPPRYNPFDGTYDVEESAYPFKNWNERIAAECYELITPILAYISSNWGPTLLEWMKREKKALYRELVRVVRVSKCSICQPYYHIIMPLADEFMQKINTIWGIRFFEKSFGYRPFGVWLPECAVNVSTLRILRRLGLRFTILGEDQVRGAKGSGFYRVKGVDDFFVFLFDREVSGVIAFGNDNFYKREFVKYIESNLIRKGIVFAATDGETFGHHKREGIATLKKVLSSGFMGLSLNVAYKVLPVKGEVDIIDNTSWSCPHGLKRWHDDCGCSSGLHPGWNQKWRKPLREAMDWLRDVFYRFFFEFFRSIEVDPEELLSDYVYYMDLPSNVVTAWLEQKVGPSGILEKVKGYLECFRYVLAIYTSCGWFFDDVSGTESKIIIRFSKKVVKNLEELTGYHIEEGFLNRLASSRSNILEIGSAREIYRKL
ncbi:MAG: DUF3536 domain-containing protein [Thermosulfidibacteraceae bacterium]|jgi:alpha-amylase/alpha-mannosidase (GH57 family)